MRISLDSYSRYPYGCRGCGQPKEMHGWWSGCASPDHRWWEPQPWLILLRMKSRRLDPNRWQRPGDEDR